MAELSPYASVTEIGAAYRAGRTTPLKVTQAALARLDRLEPGLNAFIDPQRHLALHMAETATRELADGRDRGPLHGIPVAIKDIIDIAGVPTTFATRAIDPVIPERDAELVRRLREAGAVLLGKTNLLEFAYGIVHPEVGQTNNPYDLSRTSGGSSGGSVAAVAAGIVPLAVGTDTGGSIRVPAAYCGIVGLKPSYGLVPTDGIFPLSWSLDHAGPLARSVADAALLLSCLSAASTPVASLALPSLRLGVIGAHLDAGVVTPGVRSAVETVLERARAAGATVERIDIPAPSESNHALLTVLLPEALLIHERTARECPDGYAPGTLAQIRSGEGIAAVDYVRAERLREATLRAIEPLFNRFDALVGPAVPWEAPVEDPALTGDEGEGEMLASGLANVTGQPAITLPCGLSDGLPVGLQLMGRRGGDANLLGVAAALESLIGFDARPMP